jgi:signal transduction histidine kinase
MLTAHRIADLGVWIGMTSLFYSLVEQGLLSRRLMLGFSALSFLGMLVIFAGRNGDDIQFGTSIPFGGAVAVLVVALFNAFQRLDRVNIRSASSRLQVLQLLALTSFILACFYEISVVTGVLNSSPLLPFGLLSGVFFLTLSVNEKITSTYLERDYLRKNLQKEVDKKTSELQRQTIELEQTMRSLRSTQAELVQSAKLASLGTLSAGIAHEINNSLNYVNGGLQPLVRILEKSLPETERSRADKLVGVMRDGLQLTMEIIKSLRAYTGLNQAKFNDVNLKQVVDTSLTILRNKTRGSIHTSVEVNPDIKVFGSVVGLNQVFMNLFSNAIDAMPNGGTLRIAAQRAPLDAAVTGERSHSEPNGDWVRIEVEDTGQGMPASVRERIFEPFFTTKEVGRGTGLGLHIVRTEIERHGGRLTVTSEEGKGTRFTIELPTLGQQAQTLARTELNAGPTQRSEAA